MTMAEGYVTRISALRGTTPDPGFRSSDGLITSIGDSRDQASPRKDARITGSVRMCAIKRPIEGIHGHTVCVDKGVQFRRVAVSRLMGNDCWRQKGARTMQFRDRTEAGRLLADKLTAYVDCPDLLVLALPRGGVPVAFEVARALHAPSEISTISWRVG
jgi:hypothetical protein